LKKESTKAEKKGREVAKTAKECEAQAEFITTQKAIANKELEAALPALAAAETAAKNISKKALDFLKGMGEAAPLIVAYTVDLCLILFMRKLSPNRKLVK